MRELSLHILDIVQNSIAAAATLIEITVIEDLAHDQLTITITDNGQGIPENMQSQLIDPFLTARETRAVGLGLPLFAEAAQRCDGKLEIYSQVGTGTQVVARFRHSHIDRAPLGDITGTLLSLIALNTNIDFIYHHIYGTKAFILDTREIKRELDGVAINHPEVLSWLRQFIHEGLDDLFGGEE